MSVTPIKSTETFKSTIADTEAVLVDFYAQWCQPCKQIAPKLPLLAEQFPKIQFFKVDIDELEDVATDEKITSMPTFKVYLRTKCVKTIVGASIDKIRAALEEVYEIENWSKPSAAATETPAATTTEPTTTEAKTEGAAPQEAPKVVQAGTGTVIQVESEAEFESTIQKPLVVVDFFAEWCGPCKQLAPYFKDLAKKYPNVNFIKIDFDDFEEIADKYNVASLPTLVFFKDGKAVHMNVGVNKEKIQAAFTEHFGPVA